MSATRKAKTVALTRVPRTTLAEAVFERLVTYIIGGEWKEGDKIPPERDLCVRLGIGRASVREALKALELIGLLESRVGDGTFVCARSEFLSRPLLWAITGANQGELADIIEARRLIEMDIAGLAAERATEEELQRIGEAVESFRTHIANPADTLEADMAFHYAVANAAHNPILLNAVSLLRNVMKHWLLLKLQFPYAAQRSLEQHEAVYDAIRRHKVQLARDLMSEHLTVCGRFVADIVDSRAPESLRNLRPSGTI